MKVIKLGGHAMKGDLNWASSLKERWLIGEEFVIVHGGGPQIDSALKRANLPSEFLDGLRVTSDAAMAIVEETLTGVVLKTVVDGLCSLGLPAEGISGAENNLISAKILDEQRYGRVGEVSAIDPQKIWTLLEEKKIPVISPIAREPNGKSLNVNADTAAGAIAGALRADEIIFMTDVPGIYRNWPDRDSLLEKTSFAELSQLTFQGGMLPKVAAVTSAISSGAGGARIIDGNNHESLSLALSGRGGTWVAP
jgi:acetylglutamate kinase